LGKDFLDVGIGNILDGFKKLPFKPQPIEKPTFNRLVGLKESHMHKLVNDLKVHEITMHDHLVSGRNTHLFTMVEFHYNAGLINFEISKN
jgi:hypothetical protein